MGIVLIVNVAVGIILLPLFIDTINSFLPKDSSIRRLTSKFASYILILSILTVAITGLVLGYLYVFPFHHGIRPLPLTSLSQIELHHWAIGSFVLFLWINCIYTFYRAITTSPAIPQLPPMDESNKSNQIYICKACNTARFADDKSVSHCRDCGICIALRDHHCPFTGGCIYYGEVGGNYIFFFLFVMYAWIGVSYASIATFSSFNQCIGRYGLETVTEATKEGCRDLGLYVWFFIPVICVWFPLMILSTFHLYLMYTGQTTQQFFVDRFRGSGGCAGGACGAGSARRLSFWRKMGSLRWWHFVCPVMIPKETGRVHAKKD